MQVSLPLHLHQLYMVILTHVTADGSEGSSPANVHLEGYQLKAYGGVSSDLQRHLHKWRVILCRYAMLGHEPGPMLLLAVARQALLQLDSFSPQELTNMVSQLIQSFLHMYVC